MAERGDLRHLDRGAGSQRCGGRYTTASGRIVRWATGRLPESGLEARVRTTVACAFLLPGHDPLRPRAKNDLESRHIIARASLG